ncbi:HAMP domain-containing histidine kinase [Streptomyces adustus]|uniref:histidine kinase n=1 Tax=Streptomyces adustus TaxID=1609272 RepID=A0A5N8V952_9ACTN|nr:HAMP domain-containing sensor histidine kinase [Streptomyces adustus]MPY30548.1 HAMP domain-containing histidine kinase [Streptomyces adustus]
MRQRVVRVALTAALVAVVLLAVPLALVIRSSLYTAQRDALEREALAAAVRVSPDYVTGDLVELPPAPSGGHLGLYDPRARLRAGSGPTNGDAPVRRALGGGLVRGETRGQIVVTVPVPHAEQVIGVVRASSPAASVQHRVLAAWSVLLGVAVLAVCIAVLVARRQARALAAPLEELSRHCRAVAEGDLSRRAASSSIAEIDQVARTHNEMLDSLSELLRHEHDFTSNASHQLRTPLAGLQLALEEGLGQDDETRLRPVVAEALATTERLHHTVEELLRLSRSQGWAHSAATQVAAEQLIRETAERWHGLFARDGRRLVSAADDLPADVRIPAGPVSEVLGILLDNARVHGRGTVRLRVRDLGSALAFDVSDEGSIKGDPARLFDRGHSGGGPGAGIGLALARDLAVSLGGRLSVTHASPATFMLLLPIAQGGEEDLTR